VIKGKDSGETNNQEMRDGNKIWGYHCFGSEREFLRFLATRLWASVSVNQSRVKLEPSSPGLLDGIRRWASQK
jgi:hypothetical protein